MSTAGRERQPRGLRNVRDSLNLTQKQLSDMSGIPRGRIADYEGNPGRIPNMTLRTALKLSEALGVDPRDLMPDDCT